MTRILVVGEAPSKWMEENGVTIPLPLARRELAALAGIIPPKFDELFECTNVLDKWPGKQGKGDAFPMEMARPKAKILLEKFKGQRVVLLGRRVEMAFGFGPAPWLKWWETIDPRPAEDDMMTIFTYAVCPHPSGINTWWNKAENRRAATIFWGDLAREVQFHQETGGLYK